MELREAVTIAVRRGGRETGRRTQEFAARTAVSAYEGCGGSATPPRETCGRCHELHASVRVAQQAGSAFVLSRHMRDKGRTHQTIQAEVWQITHGPSENRRAPSRPGAPP